MAAPCSLLTTDPTLKPTPTPLLSRADAWPSKVRVQPACSLLPLLACPHSLSLLLLLPRPPLSPQSEQPPTTVGATLAGGGAALAAAGAPAGGLMGLPAASWGALASFAAAGASKVGSSAQLACFTSLFGWLLLAAGGSAFRTSPPPPTHHPAATAGMGSAGVSSPRADATARRRQTLSPAAPLEPLQSDEIERFGVR